MCAEVAPNHPWESCVACLVGLSARHRNIQRWSSLHCTLCLETRHAGFHHLLGLHHALPEAFRELKAVLPILARQNTSSWWWTTPYLTQLIQFWNWNPDTWQNKYSHHNRKSLGKSSTNATELYQEAAAIIVICCLIPRVRAAYHASSWTNFWCRFLLPAKIHPLDWLSRKLWMVEWASPKPKHEYLAGGISCAGSKNPTNLGNGALVLLGWCKITPMKCPTKKSSCDEIASLSFIDVDFTGSFVGKWSTPVEYFSDVAGHL